MSLKETRAISAKEHALEMRAYIQQGEEQAHSLENRGPLRLGAEGGLHADILDAYWEIGFYVFEGVIGPGELAELRTDVEDALSRAPVTPSSNIDAEGNPAMGREFDEPSFVFARPLSDPFGGTDILRGRHEVKLLEPSPAADAPDQSVVFIRGTLRLMESCLRLYGHPELLAVAEAVNGPDFTPFTDGIFVKEPGLGAAVSWHQDGSTHWGSPALHDGSHGFNFMAQLYKSTGGNGVWVIPGTHKLGKVDIKDLVARSGSERIERAVPLVCGPGDVIICNRQLVHGSFANTSPDRRISVGFGFLPRSSVVNVTAVRHSGDVDEEQTYDEDRIRERSRMIAVAIDARQQRYPHENRYRYQPMVGGEQDNVWNEATRKSVVEKYPLLDLTI